MTDYALSVLIPTGRGGAALGRCLRSLSRQTLDPRRMQVIVVYNGQARPGAESETGWPFELVTLNCEQANASAARNLGLTRVRGEFVLLLNDDIEAEPELAATHLKAHELLERPALVLGHCDWPSYPDETVFDHLVRDTSMLFFYHRMEPRQWYGFRHAWTLNLSVPARAACETRFDERLPIYYEDLEFAWRLEKLYDMRVWYEPAALATHHHRHTWSGYLAHEHRMGQRAANLWRVNPACFEDIFATPLDEAYLEYCRRFIEIEGRREQEMRAAIEPLLAQPIGALAADDTTAEQMIQALYVAHLPLKRLAFRRGLLAAACDAAGKIATAAVADSALQFRNV